MAKKQYTAKTPINHNGEDFAVGDPIGLDDKTEAPQLLAVGAIELDDKTEAPQLRDVDVIDPDAEKPAAKTKKAAAK